MGGNGGLRGLVRLAQIVALAVGCLALANCSSSSRVDPKWGVSSSARVVEPGEPIPKGGGVYRVGKPYTVAGRLYVPEENVNYSAVGLASWYGDDFHGRYTANGEIFDMNSITAAHPTLPLPSYVRVTNLSNHKSIVVRVNDRGPYVGDRVIDLSVQTAKLLGFYGHGLARVKVEYVGRAPLTGSDDRKLMATLREGVPAAPPPVQVASARGNYSPTFFDRQPLTQNSNLSIPQPPDRPYRLGEGAREVPGQVETQVEEKVAARPAPQSRPSVDFAAAHPRAPARMAQPEVSPVSAYAPPRYDSGAGFMSGRGLY
jgi:rare lipoprotein A